MTKYWRSNPEDFDDGWESAETWSSDEYLPYNYDQARTGWYRYNPEDATPVLESLVVELQEDPTNPRLWARLCETAKAEIDAYPVFEVPMGHWLRQHGITHMIVIGTGSDAGIGSGSDDIMLVTEVHHDRVLFPVAGSVRDSGSWATLPISFMTSDEMESRWKFEN